MRTALAAALGAVVGALTLTACTAEEAPGPEPVPTSTTESPDAPEQPPWTVESLAEAILEPEHDPVDDGAPLAAVSGSVQTLGGEWAAEIAVLGLVAHEAGTDLRYVLRSIDGDLDDADRFAWGDGRKIWNDTRSVAVFEEGAEVRLLPYTGHASPIANSGDMFCTCSQMPMTVGEGDVLGALLPPLAPGTSTVTIEFPGFDPLTDVPVTRP